MRYSGSLLLLLSSCGDAGLGPAAAADAQQELPTLLALHKTAIARSCSPNPGVCHQSSNYPDLSTAGGMLAMASMPCNLELPDPRQGWDGCEPRADTLSIESAQGAPLFSSAIAYKEKLGAGRWSLGLRTPPAMALSGAPSIAGESGLLLRADPELGLALEITPGGSEVILAVPANGAEEGVAYLLDWVMNAVATGDPNRNGVWGAEVAEGPHGALIQPGSPERSYLFGRLRGTVPGTRMPLANRPLSDAELMALACWIEGLAADPRPGVNDPIDYQRCAFAQDPR